MKADSRFLFRVEGIRLSHSVGLAIGWARTMSCQTHDELRLRGARAFNSVDPWRLRPPMSLSHRHDAARSSSRASRRSAIAAEPQSDHDLASRLASAISVIGNRGAWRLATHS
jgi:hypothetical protein